LSFSFQFYLRICYFRALTIKYLIKKFLQDLSSIATLMLQLRFKENYFIY